MASRRPLFVTADGNLQEMTDLQIGELISLACWKYATTDYLTWANSATITDTRLQAGTMASNGSGYPSAAGTPDISTVTVNASVPVSSIGTTVTAPAESGFTYPLYFNGTNIQAMTQTDFLDTIVLPAINRLTSETISRDTNGTYEIRAFSGAYGSIPSVPGYTAIQTVFVDTRADLTKFTTIPEAQDQPVTVTSYFLYRKNQSDVPAYTNPVFTNADGNILSKDHSSAAFATALTLVQYAATSLAGYRIKYDWSSTGRNRGTVLDTKLNGTGRQVVTTSGGYYYSQEFPNGSPITANTYTFRISTF